MCVVPEARGRGGTAAALLGQLVAHARQHGLRHLVLSTTQHHVPAQRFYVKHGFVLASRLRMPSYMGLEPLWIYFYRRDL